VSEPSQYEAIGMKYTLSADRFRIWLIVIFLAILAFASFWTMEMLRKQSHAQLPCSCRKNEPDYFVENFNFIRLPNNGQSNYHITGQKLLHYPENENIQIIRPEIHTYSKLEIPLNIRAETATIEQKSCVYTHRNQKRTIIRVITI